MNINCPQCRHSRIKTKDTAKKIVGSIGLVGGAATGISGALNGAKLGAQVGFIAGPIGVSIGTIAGSIMGGLVGAATGGITGTQVGAVIDEYVLDNYVCLSCGLIFSRIKPETHEKNMREKDA